MTSIACKVTLNSETRRVLLESATSTTFNELKQIVHDLFDKKLPLFYTLSYKDDEGDNVTLSSDKELQEAIRLMKLINSNYLRLTIVTGNKQNDDESKNDDGNSWSFVNKNETKSGTKPNDEAPKSSLNMIQIISNICATDAALRQMLQRENIQTCLQRAFSNDDILRDPLAMESIMKSLCEENAEFKEFYKKVTERMEASNGPPAVHHGVTCDKSGMSPIIGNRYKKRNENYDLCESEYQKLSKEEQAKFEKITRPANEERSMPFPMMPPPMMNGMMGGSGPGGMMPPPMMNGMMGGTIPEGMNMPQGMNPMMMMQMMQGMMNGNGNNNNGMPMNPMQGMMNGNNNPWASMGPQNNQNMPQGMNPMMMMQMMQMMNGNGSGNTGGPMGMGGPMGSGMNPMGMGGPMGSGMNPMAMGGPMGSGMNPMAMGGPMGSGMNPMAMMMPGMMGNTSETDEDPEDMKEIIQMICSRDQELHQLSQKTTIKNALDTYFSVADANERKEVLSTLLQDDEFKSFFEKVNQKMEQFNMANMMGQMMQQGNDGNGPTYGMGGPGAGMGGGFGGGPSSMFM